MTNENPKPSAREFDFSKIEYHACLWGDCHHNKQLECFKAVAEEQFIVDKQLHVDEVARLEAEIERLKALKTQVADSGLEGMTMLINKAAALQADNEEMEGIIKRSHLKKFPDATDYTIRLELKNMNLSQDLNRWKSCAEKLAEGLRSIKLWSKMVDYPEHELRHAIAVDIPFEIDDLLKVFEGMEK